MERRHPGEWCLMRRVTMLAVILIVASANLAVAQEYLFSIPEMMLAVTVNPDASVDMYYEITFYCEPGAHAIDFVDVGLPDGNYDLGNMYAQVTNSSGQTTECYGITKSDYVDIGVAVPLGAGAIQPGQTGVFQFRTTMPNRVYNDTTRKDLAYLEITPTWFGSQYVTGTSKLGILIYLPKSVKPEELLYGKVPFTRKAQDANHTIAAWYMPSASITGPHEVSVSFPMRVMDRVVRISIFGLFLKWWEENPETRFIIGLIMTVLFGIIFFRASAGTGISCFLGLLVILGWVFILNPGLQLLGILALPFLWHWSGKALKRKQGKYLPPIQSVAGGGVKRGLTAPEAAVILELPLSRVLTMALFGLLKKGVLQQVDDAPLTLKVTESFAGRDRTPRRRAAAEAGIVLHGYEQPFISALLEAPGKPVREVNFNAALKELITNTVKKMEGFELEKTRSYYSYIVNKAWAEAKGIGDVEKRTEHTDDNLLWLMVSPDYDDEFRYWDRGGYHYHPPWTRGGSIGLPDGGSVPTPDSARTSFTDVAASFAGWSENVAGSVASSIDPAAIGIAKSGVMDLSGVDRVTMDVLESMASGSGGGGGGGGGCACAGCACACACAGGGR